VRERRRDTGREKDREREREEMKMGKDGEERRGFIGSFLSARLWRFARVLPNLERGFKLYFVHLII
jgi:hypothetical protein